MSEKWVRLLPHLQQLHICYYWVELPHLTFISPKQGWQVWAHRCLDFSQWLTQWLNWINDKMLYLLALLLKSTINHGTKGRWACSINTMSFFKEKQVQVIQYIPAHVQSSGDSERRGMDCDWLLAVEVSRHVYNHLCYLVFTLTIEF